MIQEFAAGFGSPTSLLFLFMNVKHHITKLATNTLLIASYHTPLESFLKKKRELLEDRSSNRSETEQLLRMKPWLNNHNRVEHPARAIGLSHFNP